MPMKPGSRRTIRGDDHTCVLLEIHERDAQGRPKRVTVHYDDDTVDVTKQPEFMTAWVPAHMVRRSAN